MKSHLVIGLLIAVALAGCDLVQAPADGNAKRAETAGTSPDSAFRHSQSEDISGYYRASEASVGGLTLSQVYVAQTADFEAWEAGRRSSGFAPVMLEFTRNEETIRVMPDRYTVSDGQVSMRGTLPDIGAISFDARLDKGTLATARRNLGGSEEPSMIATVNVGGRGLTGVKLHWYGGD